MTYQWRVDYGKTYLIRLVNALMDEEFFFAIAGHNLTVVGMDGSYLKPFTTSYVMIATGQTMDVLLQTNQSPGRYYMAGRQYYTDNLVLPDTIRRMFLQFLSTERTRTNYHQYYLSFLKHFLLIQTMILQRGSGSVSKAWGAKNIP